MKRALLLTFLLSGCATAPQRQVRPAAPLPSPQPANSWLSNCVNTCRSEDLGSLDDCQGFCANTPVRLLDDASFMNCISDCVFVDEGTIMDCSSSCGRR